MAHSRLETEVLVIGTGPGGATVAMLLAEAGRDVLAVDAGPLLPVDAPRPFSAEETAAKYRGGGMTVTLGGTRIVYGEGRCVGGGSEVNSALYHRAPPDVLEQWGRRHGLSAADPDDMTPHFEAVEHDLGVRDSAPPLPGASAKLHAGAQALGWQSVEVPRFATRPSTDAPIGTGRHAMTTTLLPRAIVAGTRVLPDASVRRLRREAGRWRAVVCQQPMGGPARALDISAGSVWIAAGATETPALLRRSGFRRGVGDTLRLQTMARVVARFPDRVNEPHMDVAAHQVKEFAPRYGFGCSISTRPHLAMAMVPHPAHLAQVRVAWQHMAIFYVIVRGGVGTVRTLPGFRDPLVRYRLAPSDAADLGAGMHDLCRLLLAAGAERIFPGVAGVAPVASAADLAAIPSVLPLDRTTLLSLHLMGSAPMHVDPGGGAVDAFGAVHGADDLFVADAAMLCGAPAVNPQGTIMAFARRNALRAQGVIS